MIVYNETIQCWTTDEDPLWTLPMDREEVGETTLFESYQEFYEWYGAMSLAISIRKAVDEEILEEIIKLSKKEAHY